MTASAIALGASRYELLTLDGRLVGAVRLDTRTRVGPTELRALAARVGRVRELDDAIAGAAGSVQGELGATQALLARSRKALTRIDEALRGEGYAGRALSLIEAALDGRFDELIDDKPALRAGREVR